MSSRMSRHLRQGQAVCRMNDLHLKLQVQDFKLKTTPIETTPSFGARLQIRGGRRLDVRRNRPLRSTCAADRWWSWILRQSRVAGRRGAGAAVGVASSSQHAPNVVGVRCVVRRGRTERRAKTPPHGRVSDPFTCTPTGDTVANA